MGRGPSHRCEIVALRASWNGRCISPLNLRLNIPPAPKDTQYHDSIIIDSEGNGSLATIAKKPQIGAKIVS